jgi:D-alanyl-D-alanine carboxypeptidase
MTKQNSIFIMIGLILTLLLVGSITRHSNTASSTNSNTNSDTAPTTSVSDSASTPPAPLIDIVTKTPATAPATPVTPQAILAVTSLIPPPSIDAEHAFIGLIDTREPTRIVPLFQKNAWAPAPIASITKLLPARSALSFVSATSTITISTKAESQYEHAGEVKAGEKYSREQLLYPLLISSSNDAAYALGEQLGIGPFVKAMNDDAARLGATTTHIFNVTGLDGMQPNLASAADIATIMAGVVFTNPELVRIEHIPTYEQTIASGEVKKYTTTNVLLNETFPQGWSIIAGKTGETPKAKQALVVALQTPQPHLIAITVVLRATNRVADTHTLIDWLEKAYTW